MKNNPQKMLDKIYELTYEMQKYIFLAMLVNEDKKRGNYIKKIMELNEKIDEQYSTNWH